MTITLNSLISIKVVIPANAIIRYNIKHLEDWIPAFAGMTGKKFFQIVICDTVWNAGIQYNINILEVWIPACQVFVHYAYGKHVAYRNDDCYSVANPEAVFY